MLLSKPLKYIAAYVFTDFGRLRFGAQVPMATKPQPTTKTSVNLPRCDVYETHTPL